MFALRDKIALIAGASRGLGRALAVEFARQGAGVIVDARRHSADVGFAARGRRSDSHAF